MRSISELEQKLVAGGGYEESLVSPSTISNGYGGNGWGEGGGAWGAMSGATQSMSVATVTVTGTRMTPKKKLLMTGNSSTTRWSCRGWP